MPDRTIHIRVYFEDITCHCVSFLEYSVLEMVAAFFEDGVIQNFPLRLLRNTTVDKRKINRVTQIEKFPAFENLPVPCQVIEFSRYPDPRS